MKLKKGDEVKVTKGKDKGKVGKIEKVITKEDKIVIPGINMFKRHMKGKYGQPSGIKDIVKPLPMSSVILVCPKCTQPTRVGYKTEDGKKMRICKKCEQSI